MNPRPTPQNQPARWWEMAWRRKTIKTAMRPHFSIQYRRRVASRYHKALDRCMVDEIENNKPRI